MKRIRCILFVTLAVATIGVAAGAATNATVTVQKTTRPAVATPLIPAHEWKMIREVAVSCDLNDEATWLLAAIRRHENGRPGLEFGIGGPMDSGHRAHRYQDGIKSFYVQALWAAGTIRKRFTGDIDAFGKRYNPKNAAKWSENVASVITRLKAENNHKLPGEKPAKKELKFP